MSKKIDKATEVKLARKFFDCVYSNIEDCTDVIYEFLDPDFEYGDELCDILNLESVKEVLELGFRQKYGTSWKTQAQN